MKTKFRTLITVSALVLSGVLNANAAVNSEEKNSGLISANESVTVLNEKIASFESELNGSIDYGKEAQMVTQWIADMAEARATQKVFERGFVAPVETTIFLENEVGNEINYETTDFGKEALLITKLIADKEEAKAIQKVMDRGFVAPVEATNTFENEVGYENKIETIDFDKEALLITKLIADKAEADTIQKLIAEGKLTENK